MPLQTFKEYTVDYRLKQFRLLHSGDCHCGGGMIDFIDFQSEEGDKLLVEMLQMNLVPPDEMKQLI